jgi:hypothetical protein
MTAVIVGESAVLGCGKLAAVADVGMGVGLGVSIEFETFAENTSQTSGDTPL